MAIHHNDSSSYFLYDSFLLSLYIDMYGDNNGSLKKKKKKKKKCVCVCVCVRMCVCVFVSYVASSNYNNLA